LDEQWERIEPLPPSNAGRRGHPFGDNRRVVGDHVHNPDARALSSACADVGRKPRAFYVEVATIRSHGTVKHQVKHDKRPVAQL
jgi:transposase